MCVRETELGRLLPREAHRGDTPVKGVEDGGRLHRTPIDGPEQCFVGSLDEDHEVTAILQPLAWVDEISQVYAKVDHSNVRDRNTQDPVRRVWTGRSWCTGRPDYHGGVAVFEGPGAVLADERRIPLRERELGAKAGRHTRCEDGLFALEIAKGGAVLPTLVPPCKGRHDGDGRQHPCNEGPGPTSHGR